MGITGLEFLLTHSGEELFVDNRLVCFIIVLIVLLLKICFN